MMSEVDPSVRAAVIMLKMIPPGPEMSDEEFLAYVVEKIDPVFHEDALDVARKLIEEDSDE